MLPNPGSNPSQLAKMINRNNETTKGKTRLLSLPRIGSNVSWSLIIMNRIKKTALDDVDSAFREKYKPIRRKMITKRKLSISELVTGTPNTLKISSAFMLMCSMVCLFFFFFNQPIHIIYG